MFHGMNEHKIGKQCPREDILKIMTHNEHTNIANRCPICFINAPFGFLEK